MADVDPIREFLMTRRAKVQPEDVGLPRGSRRRVRGLRREEVAALAGVSAEYYVQIERGDLSGVSDEVLHAIARALRLDEAEISHLHDLARATSRRPGAGRRTATRLAVPPAVQMLLDSMTGAAAVVQNGRLDIVAANTLGRALYSDVLGDPVETGGRPNLARYLFFDERAKTFFRDWAATADDAVAMLHTEAGRSPYSRELTDLVGELATRSDEFRRRWAEHDVLLHHVGTKRVHHPDVGDMTLQYAALDLPGATGLTIYGYTPAVDQPATSESLRLLASLAATRECTSGAAESRQP